LIEHDVTENAGKVSQGKIVIITTYECGPHQTSQGQSAGSPLLF